MKRMVAVEIQALDDETCGNGCWYLDPLQKTCELFRKYLESSDAPSPVGRLFKRCERCRRDEAKS